MCLAGECWCRRGERLLGDLAHLVGRDFGLLLCITLASLEVVLETHDGLWSMIDREWKRVSDDILECRSGEEGSLFVVQDTLDEEIASSDCVLKRE